MNVNVTLKENEFQGKLIAFCGVDGAGKSTLIKHLARYLDKSGREIIILKQPSDMIRNLDLFRDINHSRNPRSNYKTVILLSIADRIYQTRTEIIPNLKKGNIVICDRYVYTLFGNMYVKGYAKEKWVWDFTSEIVRPDITFYTSVDPQIAINRILKRPEEKKRYFNHKHLYGLARYFEKHHKGYNMKKINTSENKMNAYRMMIDHIKDIL